MRVNKNPSVHKEVNTVKLNIATHIQVKEAFHLGILLRSSIKGRCSPLMSRVCISDYSPL